MARKLESKAFAGKAFSFAQSEHGPPIHFNNDGYAIVTDDRAELAIYLFNDLIYDRGSASDAKLDRKERAHLAGTFPDLGPVEEAVPAKPSKSVKKTSSA